MEKHVFALAGIRGQVPSAESVLVHTAAVTVMSARKVILRSEDLYLLHVNSAPPRETAADMQSLSLRAVTVRDVCAPALRLILARVATCVRQAGQVTLSARSAIQPFTVAETQSHLPHLPTRPGASASAVISGQTPAADLAHRHTVAQTATSVLKVTSFTPTAADAQISWTAATERLV